MQARRDRLIQIFDDGVRFEQRDLLVDAQHRHLLVRRDGEEPFGPVVRLNMPELERDALFAQHDRRALHPRAGFKAYQKIFCHDLLAGLVPPLRVRKSIALQGPKKWSNGLDILPNGLYHTIKKCPLLRVKRTSLSLVLKLSAPDRTARRTTDLWRRARFFVAGRGVGGTDKSALEPHRRRERTRARRSRQMEG